MPIFPEQAWHSRKFTHIARHKGRLIAQRGCGNQRVMRPNRCTCRLQACTNPGGTAGTLGVESHHLQWREQLRKRRQSWLGKLSRQAQHPIAQFVLDDSRHAKIGRPRRPHPRNDLRLAPKIIADRIAIEQPHYLPPESRGILCRRLCRFVAQWEIRKAACQIKTVLRPRLSGMLADKIGHPAAFRHTLRLCRALDQFLCAFIQVQSDLRHFRTP